MYCCHNSTDYSYDKSFAAKQLTRHTCASNNVWHLLGKALISSEFIMSSLASLMVVMVVSSAKRITNRYEKQLNRSLMQIEKRTVLIYPRGIPHFMRLSGDDKKSSTFSFANN